VEEHRSLSSRQAGQDGTEPVEPIVVPEVGVLPADRTPIALARDLEGLVIPAGWRLVALIGSLSIFGPLCIDMYLPALPQMHGQLHAGASSVQLTLTGCLLGISLGQLLIGPVSDRLGHRPPLLAGIAAFICSSAACALAPDIYVLTVCRVIQGVGGAAGIVIARSIVRDLHSGLGLVRFLSTLMLATGLGPLVAPQIGSALLTVAGWREIFWFLAAMGVILLWSAWRRIPETCPPHFRSSGGLTTTLTRMASLLRDRYFLGNALACGLGIGGVFAYIAGSSFVLQNVYGLSPGLYSLVFALNACGLVIGAQVNGRLAGRYTPSNLLAVGLATMICAGSVLLGCVLTGLGGLGVVIPCLFATMFGNGFVSPNSSALALQRYPDAAGAAAAVLGAVQFLLAALVAPVAGVGGAFDALPMSLLIVGLPAAALAIRAVLSPTRSGPAA
jgi:DHA1 family bicyclomycin/chloramphenicol resistance-like MFS transporter